MARVSLSSNNLAQPAAPSPRPLSAPASFHVLAKPAGPICNLDCTYCYFLETEQLYPNDTFRMDEGTLDRYLRQLVEATPGDEITVAWQGGEPTLLGVGFYERAMETLTRHLRPGMVVHHTIQTNGTLITPEWASFLKRHNFLVGISLDGPAHLHDVYRLDKRGRPSHARVIRGLEVLQAADVDVNVLCTINAANEAHGLEVYRYFRDDLSLRHIQLIPIVETNDNGITDRSVSADGFGSFLNAIFDEWLGSDVGEVFVSHFDAALASFVGAPPALCIFSETCGNAVALEHNGDLYSCDHYVDSEHLLGNLNETHLVQLLAREELVNFGLAKRDALPAQCTRCDVRFACHGECPKNRLIETSDGEAGLNYLCSGLFSFFHHISGPMRLMAQLLRAGRYADEAPGIIRGADPAGPCPCGSNKPATTCCRRLLR